MLQQFQQQLLQIIQQLPFQHMVPLPQLILLVFLQLDQDQSLYLNYIDKDLEYLQMNKMVLYQLL